jgi:tetratricopeptide (TPR) repeat protein
MRTSRHVLALAVAVMVMASGSTGCNFSERMHLKRGNELYTAQKYEEAIGEYAKLLQINPDSWDGNYLTAVCYLALYHPGSEHPKDKEYAEKGLAAFEKTLSLTPPNPEAREKTEKYYLGFLDATGDKDKAIAYLEGQLKSRPTELPLINQIATLYQKKGDFENALNYFQKRAEMEPNSKEAWYTLGVNCWARSYKGGVAVSQEEREQVVDRGIAAFEKALAIDPKYFDALSYINLTYREKSKALAAVGKIDEANAAYQKAEEYKNRAMDLRKEQAASKPKAN